MNSKYATELLIMKGRYSTELIEAHVLYRMGQLGHWIDNGGKTNDPYRKHLHRNLIQLVFLTFYYYYVNNFDAQGQF